MNAYRPPWTPIHLIGFLLMCLLLLPVATPAVGFQPASTCSITLVYQGRDKVIITYTFDGGGSKVSLVAAHASGQTQVVAGPAEVGGEANKQVTGLAPGAWTLRLSDGTACVNGALALGSEIMGTPLYGDTIAGGKLGSVWVGTTQQSGTFQITGATVLGSMGLNNSADSTKIMLENSTVLGVINVSGKNLTLSNNQLLGGVSLAQRTNAVIKDNVLVEPITLGSAFDAATSTPYCGDWCTAGPEPLITGNSFVGRYALTAPDAYSWWKVPLHAGDPTTIWRPVPVGCNFYGSPFGYTPAVDNTGGPYQELPFLAYSGAYVDTKAFYAECKSPEGKYPRDDVFPKIWAEGWIAGQNVLLHANRSYVPYDWVLTGRNTLLSVDVRSTRETLAGVKFYAMFNGQRVDSLPTNVRRWYSSYLGDDGFEKTVNFLLPPVPVSEDEIVAVNDCTVYADISGLSGGDLGRPAGNSILLTGCAMQFKQPPTRQFKVYVFPVRVVGYCSGAASVSNITATLADDFAAMFPIRPQDIAVTVGPPITFDCGPIASISATAFWSAANSALNKMSALTALQTTYDRVVAVIPTKAGFGIDGANSRWNRNLLLVREDQPGALPHEMGHSLGLVDNYTGWPNATDGEVLRGLTAFNPEMDNTYGIAPGKHYWARELLPDTYDIMGATTAMWPNTRSYQFFQQYFATFVAAAQTAAAAAATAAAGAAPTELAAPAARTVFFSADMVFEDGRYYEMDRASVSLFDLTGTGLTPGSTPDLSWDDRFHVYRVEAYDTQGQRVFLQYFRPNDYWTYAAYFRGLDIPATATTMRFYGDDRPDPIVWVKDDAFAAALLAPQAGQTVTDTLTFAWQQSRADLEHLVLYSIDGGATWRALSPPFRGDRLEIGTEFLPAGKPIALRALTSDGFQHVETRVNGLTLPNRPPTVAIQFPPDGAQAPPGYAWRLAGIAGDLEDQAAGIPHLTGQWSSARDGALGVGNTLFDVVLSPGSHVLTFAAQDSQGLAARRQVTVTVAPVTGVDLALTGDSLRVLAGGYDPWLQGTTSFITLGVTNTVRVELVGAGAPVTATVAVSAGVPGGVPGGAIRLLARSAVALAPFGAGGVTVAFDPGTQKTWRITAAIEGATMPDPNRANNVRAWEVATPVIPAVEDKNVYLPVVIQGR